MRDVSCIVCQEDFGLLFLIGCIYCYMAYSFEKLYENTDTQKSSILKENKGRSGIYLWKNLVNGNRYVGSSVKLRVRLLQYYNAEYL